MILFFVAFFILLFDLVFFVIFFFKQKTAYEMRISDWSSDVCSSDLVTTPLLAQPGVEVHRALVARQRRIAIGRSEERRVGKECAVRVDLGGRRIIKKKTHH